MEINEKQGKYIDKIEQDNLKEFVTNAVIEYGTEEKLEEANKVCDAVLQLLRHKQLLNSHSDPRFSDSLISSAVIHNLFEDDEDPLWVFQARAKLSERAQSEHGIGIGITDAIFQTIEGQLGESTFIPHCRPAPNSPTDMFATVVWLVKSYNPTY